MSAGPEDDVVTVLDIPFVVSQIVTKFNGTNVFMNFIYLPLVILYNA